MGKTCKDCDQVDVGDNMSLTYVAIFAEKG